MNVEKKRLFAYVTPIFIVIALPLIAWSLLHSILTRSISDFIHYSSYVAVPIIAFMYFLSFSIWKDGGNHKFSKERVAIVVLIPFFAMIPAAGYYALAASLKDAYMWWQSPQSIASMHAGLTMLITLLIGCGLFTFRLSFRSVYGMTEALVGLVVAAQRTSDTNPTTLSDPSFYLAVLTAGVYLVVRGLDNIHQGLTKDPKDQAALFILELIRKWPEQPRSEASSADTQ